MSNTYADVDSGDPTLLVNSNDFVEIAIHRGSAAQMLDIRKGTPVNLVFSDERG
jgi:S-adenosyl-L-methionine hydrolase (adenosine-forming)